MAKKIFEILNLIKLILRTTKLLNFKNFRVSNINNLCKECETVIVLANFFKILIIGPTPFNIIFGSQKSILINIVKHFNFFVQQTNIAGAN